MSALAPFLLTGLYLALAVYSRILLGHWPIYSEFSDLNRSAPFWIIWLTFLLWGAFSLLGAPVAWVIALRRRPVPARWSSRHIITYVAGWILFVALCQFNPHGFTSVLIDG